MRSDGPAVFSKYPIRAKETHLLSEENARAAVRADIEIEGKIIHVFSTHLIHTHQKDSPLQEAQVEKLISLVPKENSIVMGDFNATPHSTAIQKMKKVFTDTDSASKPTWSVYPEGCSTCKPQAIDTRLDYIFTTPDIATDSFKVENSDASDHLPVSVFVEI